YSVQKANGEGAVSRYNDELDRGGGWAKYTRHHWLRDYRDFLEFFFSQMFNEPHSTKQIEDCVGWGLETTPETLIATVEAFRAVQFEGIEDVLRALAQRITTPVLVIHGDEDAINPHRCGMALPEPSARTLATLQASRPSP